jgi:hypothetical protein
VFASFYFSSTIVFDSRLYGAIGVVFSLVTWFIAIGAVITLGAVVGVVWDNRKSGHNDRSRQGRPGRSRAFPTASRLGGGGSARTATLRLHDLTESLARGPCTAAAHPRAHPWTGHGVELPPRNDRGTSG